MSEFFSTRTAGGDVNCLAFVELLNGTTKALSDALKPYADEQRLLLDFTAVKSVSPSVGIGLVQLLQCRGHTGFRTAVFGVSEELRSAAWTDCFMFVERKEWADSEEDALAKVKAQ